MSEHSDILDGLEGYTPGPWEMCYWSEHMEGAGHASGVYAVEEHEVEEGRYEEEEVDICRIEQWDGAREEQDANARLIARAPILVEEVKMQRSEIDNLRTRLVRALDVLGMLYSVTHQAYLFKGYGPGPLNQHGTKIALEQARRELQGVNNE